MDSQYTNTLYPQFIEFNKSFYTYITDPTQKINDIIKNIDKIIENIDDILVTYEKLQGDKKNALNDLLDSMNDIKKKIIISEELKKINDNDAGKLKEILFKLDKILFNDKTQSPFKTFNDDSNIIITNALYNINNVNNTNTDDIDDYAGLKLYTNICENIIFYLRYYCIPDDNNKKRELIFYTINHLIIIELFKNINNEIPNSEFSELSNKKGLKLITIATSYFEKNIREIKNEINNELRRNETKSIIKYICQYVITFIDTHLIPFNLNLQFNNTIVDNIVDTIVDKYIFDNIIVYNPCIYVVNSNDKDEISKKKKDYIFYSFSNKNQLYYYSIFYKINTEYFLQSSPDERQISSSNIVLYQCLIMNSTFEGNDEYTYGKFLFFLNTLLLKNKNNITNIICFVNNTKKIVDTLFDVLNDVDLFQLLNSSSSNSPSSDSSSTTSSPEQIQPSQVSPKIQDVQIENDNLQYLKYDKVSFYIHITKDATDAYIKEYIDLIVKKFEGV